MRSYNNKNGNNVDNGLDDNIIKKQGILNYSCKIITVTSAHGGKRNGQIS